MLFLKIAKLLLGVIGAILLATFFLCSLPVYMFRLLVTLYAKTFRPELGDILDGQSAGFAYDFLSSKPPRANIVVAKVIKGKITGDEIKKLILKAWIYPKETFSSYCKFSQYPACWLGFLFWKKSEGTFDIDNHVRAMTGDYNTENDVDVFLEKLLNTKLPRNQSPWKFFVGENYNPGKTSEVQQTLLIMVWHHCLGDAFAMMIAFLQAVYEGFTTDNLELPNIDLTQPTISQRLWYVLTFPFNLLLETGNLITYIFTRSPYKIPDERKKWYQVYVKSKPIRIQDIKFIKNCLGVSFTSVLVSTFSAALNINLKQYRQYNSNSISCSTVLPKPNFDKISELTNYTTGIVYKLPTSDFSTPITRLLAIHKILVNRRKTVVPTLLYYYTVLAGNHIYPFTELLFVNKVVPIGISNFASIPYKITKAGNIKECTRVIGLTGGVQGDAGMAVTVVSHMKEVQIQVCVENGLMSNYQAQNFLDCAVDEIYNLKEHCEQRNNP